MTMYTTLGPIGRDGEITRRNDLHGSPLEVVIGTKAWLCDHIEQANALFISTVGRQPPALVVYPRAWD